MTNNKSQNNKKLVNIGIHYSIRDELKEVTKDQRANMGQIAEILLENYIEEVREKGFFIPQKYNIQL